MNRRGDIAVVLIVILTLAVSLAALTSYVINKNSAVSIVSDAGFIESVYMKEEQVRFYSDNALQMGIAKAYSEFSFGRTGEKDLFSDSVKRYFKEEVEKLKAEDKVLTDFKTSVKEDKFALNFDSDKTEFSLNEISIGSGVYIKNKKRVLLWNFIPTPVKADELEANIGVLYRPKIEERVYFSELGLKGFDELEEDLNYCKQASDFSGCLKSREGDFDLTIAKADEKYHILMESKRSFVISGKLQPVRLEFDFLA